MRSKKRGVEIDNGSHLSANLRAEDTFCKSELARPSAIGRKNYFAKRHRHRAAVILHRGATMCSTSDRQCRHAPTPFVDLH